MLKKKKTYVNFVYIINASIVYNCTFHKQYYFWRIKHKYINKRITNTNNTIYGKISKQIR